MSDERFNDLRSDIERNILQPDFDDVVARARSRRRRRRLNNGIGAFAAVAVLLPALTYVGFVLSQASNRPGIVQIGIAGGGAVITDTTQSGPSPDITATLVAVSGVDLAHAYGLVDECSGSECDLQLVALAAKAETKRAGLLRKSPLQSLEDPRLVALDYLDVQVSGVVGNDIGPTPLPVSLRPIFPAHNAPSAVSGAVPVQLDQHGPIGVVWNGKGEVSQIPSQPALLSPELVSTVHGWWVTGEDPTTKEVAVAVSRNNGATWSTSLTGVIADPGYESALATADGRKVYLLVHSSGQMLLFRSTDSGASWPNGQPENKWSGYKRYGILTPQSGSISVWLSNDDAAGISYLRSTDAGSSFSPVIGPYAPTGEVVSLSDGYVSLGTQPSLSKDSRIWTSIALPIVQP